MPIDASIPMTGRALRLDNPLDSYSKYNAILGAQSQNRLADLVMSQKQGEMAAAAAEDRAYSAAGDPRDPNYRANLEAAMVNEGRGRNVPGMRTAFAAQDESGLKVEKARVDTALSQYGLVTQLLSGATPENYQAVLGEVAKINPGSAKNLPPVYEKVQLDAAMVQGIPRLEQMKQRKAELDAAEAARNAQLNRDVTMRGQDMASARGNSIIGLRQQELTQKQDGANKPLPVGALKMRVEAQDAADTADGINGRLSAAENRIASGKLSFGPVSNLIGSGLNMAGMSTENSRNFASFKTDLEKMRNDSLRLNRGVQTDGDAQRAWNELFQNINDTELVKQRLAEIKQINARAKNLRLMEVDTIDRNYGRSGDAAQRSVLDEADAILRER